MTWRSPTQTQAKSSFTPVQTGWLQRKCASCGQHTIAGGECSECTKEKSVLQRKLTIGASNDPLEREADRTAAEVMRMPDPPAQREPLSENEEEEIQTKPIAISSVNGASLQQNRSECKPEQGQRSALPSRRESGNGMTKAGSDIESRLSISKGKGSPLSDEVRSFMEPRFRADFSRVRAHTGSTAIQMNRDLSAQAFTHGSDIYFGAGKSPANSDLTAHELTHVVQQTGGVQAKPIPTVQQKCSECEADEQKVQRRLNFTNTSQSVIQRFWSSEESQSQEDSSGSWLDWAKETGGQAVDWAKEKAGSVSNSTIEDQRSSALAQIGGLQQRLSAQSVLYMTEGELSSLNQHIATIRERTSSSMELPAVVATSVLTTAEADALPIVIPTIESLLEALIAGVATLTLSELLIILAIIFLMVLLLSQALGRSNPSSPSQPEEEEWDQDKSGVRQRPKNVYPKQPPQPARPPQVGPRTGPTIPVPVPEDLYEDCRKGYLLKTGSLPLDCDFISKEDVVKQHLESKTKYEPKNFTIGKGNFSQHVPSAEACNGGPANTYHFPIIDKKKNAPVKDGNGKPIEVSVFECFCCDDEGSGFVYERPHISSGR